MKLRSTTFAGLLAVLVLAAAACGGGGGGGGAGGAGGGGNQGGQSQKQAPKPVAQVNNLTGESTAVKLDPMFVKGITKLGLTPGTVGKAKLSNGTVTFPITGGKVTYYKPGSTTPYVRGMIFHKGSGLSLSNGKTKVELTDFVVNPGNSVLTGKVTANGKVATQSAPLFFLNGSTLKPLMTKGNKAILEGTTVSLTQEAAMLLDKTFDTSALTKGFPVGTAKITINTK